MFPFQYTPQIEESTKTLAEMQEYQRDKVIPQLCRLQSIALKISNLYNDPEDYLGSSKYTHIYIYMFGAIFS